MKTRDLISPFFLLGVKDFKFDADLKKALKEFPIGGLVLFNSPHDSPLSIWKDQDVALEMIYDFMRQFDTGVLAIDQEGGRVRRLRKPFVELPSAAFMGRVFQERGMEPIREIYALAAEQMALTKINLNFAPVCDLAYSDAHPAVMGDRCFSSKSETVIALAELFCHSFSAQKIHCVLKHFPGHGPSRFDSHERAALLFKSKEELNREDSQVFGKVASSSFGIMTAHIVFEDEPERIFSLDSKWIPEAISSFSPDIRWFTDDLLTMKAVSEVKPWLKCLELNYDYLLLCDGLDKSIPALEESIRWAEQRQLPFSEELRLEKKAKQNRFHFSNTKDLLPFDKWKNKIISLYQKSEELIHKLKAQME